MRKKLILLVSMAIITCLCIIPGQKASAVQPRYIFIDQVTNNTNPTFVDDRSLAVGQSFFSRSVYHAFLWNKATRVMQDLGALSRLGAPFTDLDRSQAWCLSSFSGNSGSSGSGGSGGSQCGGDDRNRYSSDRDRCGDDDRNRYSGDDRYRCGDDDRDRCGDYDQNCGGSTSGGSTSGTGVTVVGQSWNLDWEVGGPTARARAFIWDQNRGIRDLGTLGGDFSSANGINAQGWVVGYGATTNTDAHACYWPGTTQARDIDNRVGKFSTAYAINGQNQIAGIAETDTPGIFHGFFWQAGQGMRDLAPLPGGTESLAFAINNLAASCGYSDNSAGDLRAVLWQNANHSITDLGGLGGNFNMALGLNDSGQVVGLSSTNTVDTRAFVWTSGAGMEDLNPLVAGLPQNVTLTAAYSINNSGEILVQAEGANGYVHGYLLVPFSSPSGGGSNQVGGGGNDRDRDRHDNRYRDIHRNYHNHH